MHALPYALKLHRVEVQTCAAKVWVEISLDSLDSSRQFHLIISHKYR